MRELTRIELNALQTRFLLMLSAEGPQPWSRAHATFADLKMLEDEGLATITPNPDVRTWTITDRGRRFIAIS